MLPADRLRTEYRETVSTLTRSRGTPNGRPAEKPYSVRHTSPVAKIGLRIEEGHHRKNKPVCGLTAFDRSMAAMACRIRQWFRIDTKDTADRRTR